MTDQEVINLYCVTPEAMLSRYEALVSEDYIFPITPDELAAVILRVEDKTITRQSAKRIIETLAGYNKVFINFCSSMARNTSP